MLFQVGKMEEHRVFRASLLLSYFGIRIKDIFKSDNTISRGRDRGTLSILEPPHSRYECCLHSRTPVAPLVNGICDTVTFLQYNLSRKDISTMQHPLQWHLYNKICDFISQFAVCDKKAKYQLPLWHDTKFVTQWHFPNDRVKDSSCLLSLAPGIHSLWCWRLKVWHRSVSCFLFLGWSCNKCVCCKNMT